MAHATTSHSGVVYQVCSVFVKHKIIIGQKYGLIISLPKL
jgi:hypothetical protein